MSDVSVTRREEAFFTLSQLMMPNGFTICLEFRSFKSKRYSSPAKLLSWWLQRTSCDGCTSLSQDDLRIIPMGASPYAENTQVIGDDLALCLNRYLRKLWNLVPAAKLRKWNLEFQLVIINNLAQVVYQRSILQWTVGSVGELRNNLPKLKLETLLNGRIFIEALTDRESSSRSLLTLARE